jgi:DNA-binding NarL/FixJ family response regulator
MQRPNIVIANSDETRSALLAKSLREHSPNVVTTNSPQELQHAVAKHRAEIVIADLETVSLRDVKQLRDAFGNVNVVCTHRVPDEQMWAASLTAGATDCCSSNDVDDVVRAAFHRPYKARTQAA